MSDLIDWGYLTELYRETDKPIRKDENVFYEFSSAVFANFKHILKERETQAERLAELEAEVARLRVDGARYGAMVEKLCNEPKKDFIVITGRQLKNALEFVAPDCPKDEDQLDTEVCIGFAPERVIDGETLPAGLMVWLAEYPEEGAIPLDDSPDAAKEQS